MGTPSGDRYWNEFLFHPWKSVLESPWRCPSVVIRKCCQRCERQTFVRFEPLMSDLVLLPLQIISRQSRSQDPALLPISASRPFHLSETLHHWCLENSSVCHVNRLVFERLSTAELSSLGFDSHTAGLYKMFAHAISPSDFSLTNFDSSFWVGWATVINSAGFGADSSGSYPRVFECEEIVWRAFEISSLHPVSWQTFSRPFLSKTMWQTPLSPHCAQSFHSCLGAVRLCRACIRLRNLMMDWDE